MKRIILSIAIIAIGISQINAQNTIHLNIQHKLAESEFAMNEGAKNNLDNDFSVTRLEYYISEISLVHDGGTETLIEDLWILVDAASTTQVELGEYDINSIEKIKLHIGVDPDHNHLDPSSFQGMHPLAPKFPSMHWGWTAGYRFVAIEGFGGSALNQLFQLHGLGDNNYFNTEIELDLSAENDQLVINLDADYTRALENIAVNSGVIVHGDYGAAKKCLNNFKDFVFSPSDLTNSVTDFGEVSHFAVYPNPIVNNQATISLDLSETGNEYDLSITSVDGRKMNIMSTINNGQVIDFTNYPGGIYFVNLIKEGQTIITQKILVK